jgi:TonB-linked SusC/RagA family outer membrane protein
MRNYNLKLLLPFMIIVFFSIIISSAFAQNSYSFNYEPQNKNAFKSYSQSDAKNVKAQLVTELKKLNKDKGVYFMFSNQSLNNKIVNKVDDMKGNIETILDKMLLNTGLSYKKINDNTYVIISSKESDNPPASLHKISFTDIIETENKITTAPEDIITGKVTDKDGVPIAGVTVTVKGKNKGTSTDNLGVFNIEASKGDVLVFTSVGYILQNVTVGSSHSISVQLLEVTTQLNTVVVTALGIKRERRSLGYSVTEVPGSDLTQARELNVANSLVGKVAGLDVSSIAGGPGASSNVIIRGISSLGNTNQPLYVINGVPMESSPSLQSSTQGTQYDNGVDRGDAIGNLNPDDIESISVLKGAAASALYGYRAKAGVILITTKSAKSSGIEFNSNYVAEQVINTTDWQYVYGQGANNIKPVDQTSAFQSGQSSWGAKLDGSNVVQFDGVSRPYVAQKNNLKNFYRTGATYTNTLALNKTFTGGALRFSASDLTNQDVIPNSGLDRQSFDFSGNFNPIKRLVIDTRAYYILQQAKNRPFLSDAPGNANFNVMFLPTSVDVRVLKNAVNPNGSELAYTANTFATNPWFAAEKFINNTSRDRLISSATVRYNFDNGLFLQGRVGRDAYNDRYTKVIPTGTAYRSNGEITEQSIKFSDLNVDGLAGKSFKTKDESFTITPNIGASYRRTKSEVITNNGQIFAVPYVYNILNAINKSVAYSPSDIEVQSLYGTLELDYKSWLYATGSLRSDWFSSLATPGVSNKLNIVYPSISGSFVYSEFIKNNWLTFGKLRAGYAVVGQATNPYQTQLSYTLNSVSLNGLPLGAIFNANVPNKSLRPSKASELEIGTEARLFDRVSVDLTWYNKISKNEIIFAPASISSGYGGAVLNIGELENKGFEALVAVDVFKTKSFSWTSSINGSINKNKVISLAAGQSQLAGGTSRTGVGFTASVVGLPADQIMAFDYKYDNAGKVIRDANGIPLQGNLVPLGSAYPKWIGGWNNEFSYKHFNLSFLIDGKFGGKIFSATDWYGYVFGLHKATLVDREKNFGTTAAPVYASTYYSNLASNVSRLFVLDASFIKFRQLAFGYTFPSKMFNNVIKSLNISVVGRNLFTIMKKTDNIDPESSYSATAGGLTQGLELGGVPPIRSYGVNLNVKF